jgi:hypothetical protein
MMPHGSPSPLISSGHAHEPPPELSEKHAWHVPGVAGLHASRHRPATHASPSAHWLLLHGWQVPGAVLPGRQTLELPVVSETQVFIVPHAALVHASQKPPMPMPAQHTRQNDDGELALSLVHTLQASQTSDTVQGSPVSPRGVHVPPMHVYPLAQSVPVVHWLVQVIALGTQKPSGIWQV